MRIGHGYDVHRLVEGRALIIGGVEIPHTTGLLGYSDADVLTHAIMDAVLGALALGDIGKLFPERRQPFPQKLPLRDISLCHLLNTNIKQSHTQKSNILVLLSQRLNPGCDKVLVPEFSVIKR